MTLRLAVSPDLINVVSAPDLAMSDLSSTHLAIIEGTAETLYDPADQGYCAEDRSHPMVTYEHLDGLDYASAPRAECEVLCQR